MVDYPFPIPNSNCCYKFDFEQLCVYCVGKNCKAYVQLDQTGHDDYQKHIQSQVYEEVNGKNIELKNITVTTVILIPIVILQLKIKSTM